MGLGAGTGNSGQLVQPRRVGPILQHHFFGYNSFDSLRRRSLRLFRLTLYSILATVAVAAQTLFLSDPLISEKDELPIALLVGGGLGFIATGLFNILMGRIPFRYLASFFLLRLQPLLHPELYLWTLRHQRL